MDKPVEKTRLLRRREVEDRVGLRTSAIYEKMNKGLFPKPVRIGENSVRWTEASIDQWIVERVAATRPATADEKAPPSRRTKRANATA